MNAQDIFKYFCGKWTITRHLNNLAHPYLSASAKGKVIIKENSLDSNNYSEKVDITFLNGNKTTGSQEYIFKLIDNRISQYRFIQRGSDEIEKMYDLNFVTNKERLLACSKYKCGKDLYQVEYSINEQNNFSIKYIVSGPNKNYITQTSFIREAKLLKTKPNKKPLVA